MFAGGAPTMEQRISSDFWQGMNAYVFDLVDQINRKSQEHILAVFRFGTTRSLAITETRNRTATGNTTNRNSNAYCLFPCFSGLYGERRLPSAPQFAFLFEQLLKIIR